MCYDFRSSVSARRAKHIENEQSKAVNRFPASIIDERNSCAYLALEIQWHIAGGVQLCLRFHLMRQHTEAVPGRYGGRQHVGMLQMLKTRLEMGLVVIRRRQLGVQSAKISWRGSGRSSTALFLLGRTLRHVSLASRGLVICKSTKTLGGPF